ncbi:MAG: enoyl-CoA hydratase/isomerase family protein [Myxococcales bacterium]|nr:enoyl-CoA hydratase/isomerase family protein [Myxococcales bacterium]
MAELEIRREENVAWLTLNRPAARNSLSPALLRLLAQACNELAEDEDVRAVVLRAQGGVFSAGADLMGFMAGMHGDDPEAAADIGRKAAEALLALPQVTIAAIEGHCVGGGLVLAASCDLRWAESRSWFSAPELDLGVPLAWGGMERLVALLGDTMACELVFTCRRLGVEEALGHGLISQRIDGDFDSIIGEQVAQIVAKPLGVLRTTKRQLQGIRSGSFCASADAAALLAALRAPESQRAAQQYFARRAAKAARRNVEDTAPTNKEIAE